MKLIVAIVKPFRVEEVKEALEAVGVLGLTVTEVHGHGRQKGHSEIYRGAEYKVDLVPKTRLEILADDPNVAPIIEAIMATARTDKIGDGKIWVTPIEAVYRIRTGESGPEAI